MDDKNFEKMCVEFSGEYDNIKNECILTSDSYSKLQKLQKLLEKENLQSYGLNLRDIKSGRDTNIDSFDTFDEISTENGTIAIRRPNIVNIYDSVVVQR